MFLGASTQACPTFDIARDLRHQVHPRVEADATLSADRATWEISKALTVAPDLPFRSVVGTNPRPRQTRDRFERSDR